MVVGAPQPPGRSVEVREGSKIDATGWAELQGLSLAIMSERGPGLNERPEADRWKEEKGAGNLSRWADLSTM